MCTLIEKSMEPVCIWIQFSPYLLELDEKKMLQIKYQAHFMLIIRKVKVKSLSRVTVTPWTVAHQAPPSMKFFPGKSTGVGYHFLLQGIFSTQGSNPGLLHCRRY